MPKPRHRCRTSAANALLLPLDIFGPVVFLGLYQAAASRVNQTLGAISMSSSSSSFESLISVCTRLFSVNPVLSSFYRASHRPSEIFLRPAL